MTELPALALRIRARAPPQYPARFRFYSNLQPWPCPPLGILSWPPTLATLDFFSSLHVPDSFHLWALEFSIPSPETLSPSLKAAALDTQIGCDASPTQRRQLTLPHPVLFPAVPHTHQNVPASHVYSRVPRLPFSQWTCSCLDACWTRSRCPVFARYTPLRSLGARPRNTLEALAPEPARYGLSQDFPTTLTAHPKSETWRKQILTFSRDTVAG